MIPFWHLWPFRHRHHVRVVLFVDGYGHELNPHKRTRIMTSVTAGHKVTYAIAYLDANGNPMLTTPTPDSPPAWTDTIGAADTLTVAADGNSAVLQTGAADASSTDTVGVTVVVGGKSFSATDTVDVSAAPQELTSIALVGTVS
jgi:hypothetical protein